MRPDQGLAYNVHLKADLSSYMQYRTGNLHWLLQPDKEHPLFGWACIARMVKPWDEWLFIVLPERGKELDFEPTNEQWLGRMKEFIGDDSIDTEILGISKWRINDVVAEEFSRGRVYAFDFFFSISSLLTPYRFCLGDAVHRHPPSNGLGSNTCIQDAYNLAWKVAYVLKGESELGIIISLRSSSSNSRFKARHHLQSSRHTRLSVSLLAGESLHEQTPHSATTDPCGMR